MTETDRSTTNADSISIALVRGQIMTKVSTNLVTHCSELLYGSLQKNESSEINQREFQYFRVAID